MEYHFSEIVKRTASVAVILLFAAIITGCSSNTKALDSSQVGSDGTKKPAVASDPGSPGQGGEDGADGGMLGDDPIPLIDPFEFEYWDIRSFTDPRTNETYDIIDGRVIIAFTNPPVLPDMDPNYFDEEIPPDDPYYQQFDVPEIGNDPAIQTFIAAENLTIFSEWNTVKGIGAILPPGQTVEDAVANWPTEYAGLVEAVDPDALVSGDAWPQDDPNDDLFPNQWNINEDYNYDINIQDAWENGCYYSEAIAVLDTGIQRRPYPADMSSALLSWGVNIQSWSYYGTWSQGGGEPSWYLLNISQDLAREVGHGTCVASVMGAAINNDPGYQLNDELDVCGIIRHPVILPVAIFCYTSLNSYGQVKLYFSNSAIINAYECLGYIKRIYKPNPFNVPVLYNIPYLNIEVVNCSYGSTQISQIGLRHLDKLTRYMLFVCSAGNLKTGENPNVAPRWPARHGNALSVGSHDNVGRKAVHSVRGSIYAPGVNITAVDMVEPSGSRFTWGYVANPDTFVSGMQGTSFAAPHVSAVAGMLSRYRRIDSPFQLRSRIMERSDWVVTQYGVLGWKLNAYNTLRP